MAPIEFLEAVARDGGGRCRFRIPGGSPYFAGHFPGRPLLPGVAHFGLVVETIARLVGAEVRFASVDSVRFRKPLGPGDAVDVEIDGPGPDGRVRFALRSGIERISQGEGRVEPRAADAPREAGAGSPRSPEVPGSGIEVVLPHVLPARLLDRVLEADDRRAVGAIVVPEGSPFLGEGGAASFVAFEMAAQTAAALEAIGRARSGADAGPRAGYLVAVRDARLHTGLLPVDRPLRAKVEQTEGAFPLTFYRMVVTDGGRTLVEGTIGTYLDASRG